MTKNEINAKIILFLGLPDLFYENYFNMNKLSIVIIRQEYFECDVLHQQIWPSL